MVRKTLELYPGGLSVARYNYLVKEHCRKGSEKGLNSRANLLIRLWGHVLNDRNMSRRVFKPPPTHRHSSPKFSCSWHQNSAAVECTVWEKGKSIATKTQIELVFGLWIMRLS
ncbi:hypothetical protein RUM43_000858 [Polyplax serrata]|uniref:Uncharacterized protein n=1 Tax=Polyplax serrata TaxID=468196 RepID=A0AAN8XR43_POLSC